MINIRIRTNVAPISALIDENTSIRAALEQNDIDYSHCHIMIDGAPIRAGGLDQTFAELGYNGTPGHDKAYLACVAKVDNAA